MRLSPLLTAILAVTASIGLSNSPSHGQTTDQPIRDFDPSQRDGLKDHEKMGMPDYPDATTAQHWLSEAVNETSESITTRPRGEVKSNSQPIQDNPAIHQIELDSTPLTSVQPTHQRRIHHHDVASPRFAQVIDESPQETNASTKDNPRGEVESNSQPIQENPATHQIELGSTPLPLVKPTNHGGVHHQAVSSPRFAQVIDEPPTETTESATNSPRSKTESTINPTTLNHLALHAITTPTVTPTPPLIAQVQVPPTDAPTPPTNQPEPRVLVSEVVIDFQDYTGPQEQLENEIFRAISTRPGLATTRSQLQQDVNAVFATGFFRSVDVVPEDTPLGVRITFVVEPNPVLRQVAVNTVPPAAEARVLPQEVVDQIFQEQYGEILNLNDLQQGIQRLNDWYQEQGYDLAQVVDASDVNDDGIVTVTVAEGVIEEIAVRYLDEEGEPILNDEGEQIRLLTAEDEPIGGRTRPFIITREMQLDEGDVFNRQIAERDLRRVFGLGLFDDVRLSFAPGTDPRRVVVVVDVIEKNTGSLAAGAGVSSASGLFGTVSYQQQNLGGNNQTLGAEFQVGERALLFDLRFTDPWIAGDPFRTSYTVNAFRRRSISLIFDGGDPEVELPNGDRPRVVRTGGGVNFTRPLSRDLYRRSEWTASAGFEFQNVSIRDSDGDLTPEDELGNDLSFSGDGEDDLFTLQLGAVRDRRNNPLRPTSGSLLRFGVEQTIPIGQGSIFLNRLRGSYSYYLPVEFTDFTEGAEALAFNVQAGTAIGDLPPYEAFSLGGSNSVRGYDEGEVGSGRSFIQATAEYRFPIISVVGGALFVDFASDLGTGDDVPGEPAIVRDKPGTGFGYGIGIRVQSPLGPIRVDYGFNDEGDSRLHFGIGERF
ncbi:outer membrane protein, OMP85 family, putative [Coleofasciculus chthonoplastes PCC 7420]|uniref:Outer membrane protein, OMP85 family, putative n=1 Tax=Coleofasciculus chthonoplastes PCC 7420 TaxID=118168 RepID=B4VY37_9CYAN|nr:BamA/TamA family outer membrane protein [Coleofasciculus chthonoplastes]EDX73098.1 outer membrane protein, OMP85 family, putative [Coleofasciculus chthonoplastes PCC 7420]